MDLFAETALAQPPVAGMYRVVVLESDLRRTVKDFALLSDAQRYADDAASEADDHRPIAKVFSPEGVLVHEGKPYFSQG